VFTGLEAVTMCGGHGWGGQRSGFGFFFPALLIGRLIAEAASSSQRRPGWAQDSAQPASPGSAAEAPGSGPRPNLPQMAAGAAACPGCHAALGPGFRFCPHCGRKLAPAACRYCGQALTPPARYCGTCGAPQSVESSV
jgi:RNA polymerase subunit RPABC4/transcription elongation factor Spt4